MNSEAYRRSIEKQMEIFREQRRPTHQNLAHLGETWQRLFPKQSCVDTGPLDLHSQRTGQKSPIFEGICDGQERTPQELERLHQLDLKKVDSIINHAIAVGDELERKEKGLPHPLDLYAARVATEKQKENPIAVADAANEKRIPVLDLYTQRLAKLKR
jgi:hypothetical protein